MATPLYSSKLSGSKSKNWIKAGLAVLFTKEGIEPFVYDEIKQFQQKCLKDISNNNGIPAGSTCFSCCTENVIVCPTNKICNGGRGKCKFHRNAATQYLPFGCPNKICNNFKNEIQNAHRFHCPSFKNTDATQWCTNPWEVAKCFMPPDGYKDVTSAAETDFNGIISVIINYKAFQSKVQDDLSKTCSIFAQGREIGKAVRHSPQLEVEDTDLQQYFTDLLNLLSDPAYLSTNTDAKNAKTKLLQLQNDSLIIGKDDVRKVLDDVAKAVQDKIKTNLKEAEKKKVELINVMNESVKAIDNKESISIAQLDIAFKSAIDELKRQTNESLTKVKSEAIIAQKHIEESTDKGVDKLEVEAEARVKLIEESADIGVNKLEVEAETGVKQIEESTDKGVNKLEAEAKAGVKQIEDSTDKGVIKLEVGAQAGAKQIEESADKVVNKLEVETKAGVKQIEESTDKGVNKLEVETKAGVKQTEESTDKGINKLEVEAEAGVKQIEESTDKGVNKLEDGAKAGVKKIEESADKGVNKLEVEAKAGVKQLEESTDKGVNKLEDGAKARVKQIEESADKGVNKLEDGAKAGVKQIEESADKGAYKLEDGAKAGVKQIGESTDKGVNKLEVEAEAGVKQIEESTNKGVNKLEDGAKARVKQIEESADKGVRKLKDGAKAGVKQIEESADKRAYKLEDGTKAGVKQIEESTDKGVNKLEVEAEAGITKISAKTDEALKQIEKSTTANKEDKYNKVKEGTPKGGKEPNVLRRLFGKLPFMSRQKKEGNGTKQAEDAYVRRKEELKDDLATFYSNRYSTIPLSPLFEEHDTPLVDFYILPEMNFIEKKNPAGEETKTPVKSLSDLFQSEKSSEIYLSADAGFGKTAFSKYLAITWCQAHRPETKCTKYFNEDVIKAMLGFEFLFLVLLRDSSDDCSIDDLIMNQIMQNLSRDFALTKDFVQEILHRERHLIILDGLDEWIHPEKKCAKVPKTNPHRNARETCVILTTSRPWKLGVLNLKTSEIGKKVELVKLTSESAQILEERAISKIKNLHIAEAKLRAKQLNKKVKENKLEDLESVPLLTMYLICLWCDNIPLGQSKCGLYASIIELLLSRTISKHPEVKLTCEPSQSDIPQCFSEDKHCTKYCTYLKALGQLAFETLFSETKESTLVFSQSVTEKYLSSNYLKFSLDSGILTQSTEKTLTKQISKCSFSHKTIQEFFCALYISCQNESDVKEIFLKECKSVQSILDMSTVFVFTSGMVNAEIISSISPNFMSVISEDTRTSEYRTTTDQYCEPLKDIQDMYMSCMKENTSDKELKVCCQDFFFSEDCKEEKYFKHLARLAVHNKTNMASINIDTYSGRSLREIIDCCALHELFQINKIYCRGNFKQPLGLLPVLFNKSPKCLTVIGLSFGPLSREMLETLQNNSLLQAIYIHGFFTSHNVLNEFLNYIINRKTMTEIRLRDLHCVEHYKSCSYSLDFSQHSDLRKLELGSIPEVSQLKVNSQVEHVKLVGINLGEMSLPSEMGNIKHVDLRFVNMSASTLRDLVKVVEKLSHKVTVTIYWCKIEPRTEFEHVKQYIRSSQNLRVTRDNRGEFVFETKVES